MHFIRLKHQSAIANLGFVCHRSSLLPLQLGILFMKSPDQGGDTIVYAALSPGMYVNNVNDFAFHPMDGIIRNIVQVPHPIMQRSRVGAASTSTTLTLAAWPPSPTTPPTSRGCGTPATRSSASASSASTTASTLSSEGWDGAWKPGTKVRCCYSTVQDMRKKDLV